MITQCRDATVPLPASLCLSWLSLCLSFTILCPLVAPPQDEKRKADKEKKAAKLAGGPAVFGKK